MGKPQAIKYEGTTIDPATRVARIMALVQKYGGSEFTTMFGLGGEVAGVRFTLRTAMGEVPVRVTAPIDEVRRILSRARPSWTRDRVRVQANRVAWGHLSDLIEQQLLAVHLGLKSAAAAFMDSLEVVDPQDGQAVTMAELMARHAQLPAGGRGAVRLLPPVRP